jgi:hypothetical protein
MFDHVFQHRVLELLEPLNQRMNAMTVNLANLTAAEQKLVADVQTLIGVVTSVQAQVAALQAQIAAGNTDAETQAALDQITASLTAEDVLVVATTNPPAGPIGVTSITGATGGPGTSGATAVTGATGS